MEKIYVFKMAKYVQHALRGALHAYNIQPATRV